MPISVAQRGESTQSRHLDGRLEIVDGLEEPQRRAMEMIIGHRRVVMLPLDELTAEVGESAVRCLASEPLALVAIWETPIGPQATLTPRGADAMNVEIAEGVRVVRGDLEEVEWWRHRRPFGREPIRLPRLRWGLDLPTPFSSLGERFADVVVDKALGPPEEAEFAEAVRSVLIDEKTGQPILLWGREIRQVRSTSRSRVPHDKRKHNV